MPEEELLLTDNGFTATLKGSVLSFKDAEGNGGYVRFRGGSVSFGHPSTCRVKDLHGLACSLTMASLKLGGGR